MTATRSTKEERLYRQHRKDYIDSECPFCLIKKLDAQYVEETKNLKVIRNHFPYSIWDGQGVVDHLMIVPKRHTDKLGSLSLEAAGEYISLVDKYELDGYNVYARAPGSNVKSIVHHHTHLIRLDGETRRFIFLLRKPFYFRFTRR